MGFQKQRGKTVAFYGHTSAEFDCAFSRHGIPLREMQDLYQILLISIINDQIRDGFARFATTAKEGVNSWLSQYIAEQKRDCVGRQLELSLIVPSNPSLSDPARADFSSADHIIHMNTNDEPSMCEQLLILADHILLFSFTPTKEAILQSAISYGKKAIIHTPYELMSSYIKRKKGKGS